MSGNSTSASFTSNSSNATFTTAGTPGMSREEKAILMPFYFTSLLVALIGNVLIIVVFYKYKPIRKSINYFVLNMAISDLFTPLTIMPFIIASTLSNGPGFLNQLPSSLAEVVCENFQTGLKYVFFGISRAGSLSLSANTKLTLARKRTRGPSSYHFSMRAVGGSKGPRFKLAGEEKELSQEQEKGNDMQEQKL